MLGMEELFEYEYKLYEHLNALVLNPCLMTPVHVSIILGSFLQSP